jgi:hypothetical protein
MAKLSNRANGLSRQRIALYGAIAVGGVLALAYFDGGEEPIRPIAEQVSLPGLSVREK